MSAAIIVLLAAGIIYYKLSESGRLRCMRVRLASGNMEDRLLTVVVSAMLFAAVTYFVVVCALPQHLSKIH